MLKGTLLVLYLGWVLIQVVRSKSILKEPKPVVIRQPSKPITAVSTNIVSYKLGGYLQ